jgi:hypothetical protein
MAIDLVKLKVEITNNPARYQGLDDEGIAALLAVVDQDVPRENMDGGLLVSCISKAEFTALPTRSTSDSLPAQPPRSLSLLLSKQSWWQYSALVQRRIG